MWVPVHTQSYHLFEHNGAVVSLLKIIITKLLENWVFVNWKKQNLKKNEKLF